LAKGVGARIILDSSNWYEGLANPYMVLGWLFSTYQDETLTNYLKVLRCKGVNMKYEFVYQINVGCDQLHLLFIYGIKILKGVRCLKGVYIIMFAI